MRVWEAREKKVKRRRRQSRQSQKKHTPTTQWGDGADQVDLQILLQLYHNHNDSMSNLSLLDASQCCACSPNLAGYTCMDHDLCDLK